MSAATLRLPILVLFVVALVALGLDGCLRPANAPPEELNLGRYRYAVSVFNNHDGYNARAEAALARQGLIIIEADDQRPVPPETAKLTLFCTFDMVTEGMGLAARMIIRDAQGHQLFEAHARRLVDLLSIDAVVDSLTRYRAVGAPQAPPPGTVIEM